MYHRLMTFIPVLDYSFYHIYNIYDSATTVFLYLFG